MENIYAYFAAFLRAARRAQWSQERIDAVMVDARSQDYEYAVSLLSGAILKANEEAENLSTIAF
jgi:hypothetical protein